MTWLLLIKDLLAAVWLSEATTSQKWPLTLRILGGHLRDIQLHFTYVYNNFFLNFL